MPENFLACDRDQELLLPPNLRDWLPADHFAWFVLDAVEEMNEQGARVNKGPGPLFITNRRGR